MKNKLRISALAVIIIFITTSVADAQRRGMNSRMSFKGQCLEIPDLTDKQKEEISAINVTHQEKIDNMRDELVSAEDVYSANELKAKMTLEQNTHLKGISKVLNEDQLEYFNENILDGKSRNQRAFNRSPRGGRGASYADGDRGRGSQRFERAPRQGRKDFRGQGRNFRGQGRRLSE